MDNYTNGDTEIFGMELDPYVKSVFHEMTRWTKFLAILGFICLGLMMVGGFFFAIAVNKLSTYSPLATIGSAGMVMIYVLIAGVNFYPTYALLKYSTCMKAALSTNNKLKFNEAINYLKNFFKFIGVLTVILLCLYGLVIVFAIIAAAVGSR